MLTAVVGVNWGDEGKGRMVDLLAGACDIVARYQGGNNAGHTVVNPRGKFILNLLPSGILHDGTVNIMGGGMVIDIQHLTQEMDRLRDQGIRIEPDNLLISHRATVCMPYHRQLDQLEEARMGKKKAGSTQRGIAPSYADRYMRKSLRMGDLLHSDTLKDKVRDLIEWKNLTVHGGYREPALDLTATMEWLETHGTKLLPFIKNCDAYLDRAAASGKRILFEAQLGALRDIDYGIYPYTSSSSTLAAYAPIGAGIPAQKLDCVIGIVKAYSSAVGGGPFTCELFGPEGDTLREAGAEYGAATGRPRRVGGFDVVASRYGVRLQGATELALTKLDVLSYLSEIPVCVAYEVDGKRVDRFPTGDELDRAKPVYETLPGFKVDISKARKKADLPKEAVDYIDYIQAALDCRVKYVSVGPGRDDYLLYNEA